MNIIYVDTISEWMVLANYFYDGSTLSPGKTFKEKIPREGGIRLAKEFQILLQEFNSKKPDLIFVLHGPGSFTGIRIGLSFVRAYSQALQIPCIGLNTLEVYTHYYFQKYSKRSMVLLDGRMKKVYGGVYSDKGFENSVDLPLHEAMKILDQSNTQIFSDISNPGFKDLSSDYPNPFLYIKENIENFKNSKYENYSYKNLTPNYMRGTYVDGK